jgi:HEAT repeat protein
MIRRFSVIVLLATILPGCFVSTTPDPDITISRLLALLHSSDPALRQTAALSLGKIAPAEAATGLMEALHDSDPLVRQYSAWALGHLGDHAPPTVLAPLLSLLNDPDLAVADTAAEAIGQIGAGTDTVSQLLTLVREGRTHSRRAAALALESLESPLSYDALLRALGDEDADVRQRAIAALGEVGDRRAVPALMDRLAHDPTASVRTEAAYRLGLLGDVRALSILKSAREEDPSGSVRRWAQQAIEALSSPAAPESKT